MPGAALGLRTLFGYGDESTWGTAAAVTRRLEIVSESLAVTTNILESQGISGSFTARRGARRVISSESAEGSVTHELSYTGMGLLLKHITGATAPTVAQQAATTAYLHTYPGDGNFVGKGLTVQKSLRDGAGAEVATWTLSGCKITDWSLAMEVDAVSQVELTLDGKVGVTSVANTALNALAVPTSPNFNFKQGAILVAGSPVGKVLSGTAKGGNALKTDSYYVGSGGLKGEQDVTDFRTLEGTLSYEIADTTLYNLFKADTAASLKLEWVGPIIATTNAYRLTLNIPEVHFTGDTPQVGGPGLVTLDAPWTAAINPAGNPLYTFELMTTDTAS